MDNPKVSVICGAYNHEKYIKQSLHSMIMQKTDFEYEIIISDDASTDKTTEILLEYQKMYSDKVTVVLQNENQYSRGVQWPELLYDYIKGEYIAICECDDYWTDENKLQIQVDILDEHPEYSGCGHNVGIVDDDGNSSEYAHLHKKIDTDDDTVKGLKDVYVNSRLAHTCSIMFRSDLIFDMDDNTFKNYKNLKIMGDNKISAIIAASGSFYHIAKEMGCYRYVTTHGHSWSTITANSNLSLELMQGYLELEDFISSSFDVSNLYTAIKVRHTNAAIQYYLNNPSAENTDILTKILDIWSF